jgi:hypothetical protein
LLGVYGRPGQQQTQDEGKEATEHWRGEHGCGARTTVPDARGWELPTR